MDREGGKSQMVMLVSNELIDRADALRIVMRDSEATSPYYRMNRARVLEMALTNGGLKELEKRNQQRLLRLEALAHRAGQSYSQFVHAYVRQHERKTYAPTLEELEASEKQAA